MLLEPGAPTRVACRWPTRSWPAASCQNPTGRSAITASSYALVADPRSGVVARAVVGAAAIAVMQTTARRPATKLTGERGNLVRRTRALMTGSSGGTPPDGSRSHRTARPTTGLEPNAGEDDGASVIRPVPVHTRVARG